MLIIGRSYTATDLGFFSQADRIKTLASHTTTQVVQSVSYPILSKINNETGDIKVAYKEIISITLIFVGFIMSLLIGCAEDLFEFFMGSTVWRVSGTFFILMGINGILFPLHCINQNILMVKGDSKTILWLEIIRRSIMVIILLITLQFDIKIFVLGLSIYSLVLLFLNLYFCGKPINYTIFEQLKDTFPLFIRFAIIIASMVLIRLFVTEQSLIIRLILSNFVGLSIGLAIFWKQQNFKNMLNLALKLIKNRHSVD
jgi:O-antigen/teichoic acid export membrane protein